VLNLCLTDVFYNKNSGDFKNCTKDSVYVIKMEECVQSVAGHMDAGKMKREMPKLRTKIIWVR
jgi:hypothetical protein